RKAPNFARAAGDQSGSLPSNSWRPALTATSGRNVKYWSRNDATNGSQLLFAAGVALDLAHAEPASPIRTTTRIASRCRRVIMSPTPVDMIAQTAGLVVRRLLHVLDDEHVYWTFRRLE